MPGNNPVLDVLPLDAVTDRGRQRSGAVVELGENGLQGLSGCHGGLEANFFASLDANNIARKPRKMLCVKKKLSTQVQEFMDANKLNASGMAELASTSRQNIENVLDDSVKQPRYLAQLARAMGTSIDVLLAGRYKVTSGSGHELQPSNTTPYVGDFPSGSQSLTKRAGGRVGFIAIAALDIKASMGAGVDLPAVEEAVSEMVVDTAWLRRVCTFTNPDNLSLITGSGDSMVPTFSDGDALLVDRGVSDVKTDAIYCLALNESLYVKRLQRRPDGKLLMISDNPSYQPYEFTQADRENLNVLGRVVMAWNARRL